MRSARAVLLSLLAAALGCGGTTSGKGGTTSAPSAPNVLPVSVNGSLCAAGSYPNKPCVSVTVCDPTGSTCQTIDDILLDTGSSGLRLFKSVVTVPLTPVTVTGGTLAQCTQYADGTSQWGPVEMASVGLGGEPLVLVPIQIADASFGTPPAACASAQAGPADGGYNGILGLGPFAQDCGSACAAEADVGIYYACTGATCSGTTVALAAQVENPVALLPVDHNGLAVELPSVPPGGALSVEGQLVLGIGTRTNNAAAGVTPYPVDETGEFTTTLAGANYRAFLDTGSNGLFFGSPTTALPECASPDNGWYCPSTTETFSAVNAGATGSPTGTVTFEIGDFEALVSSNNNAFPDLGGTGDTSFDWGLPFHLGRKVYVGLEGESSPLGTGPLFAY
ncbi:MAG TPA: DUF3443 domain-containing protein [Anaeromyxobacteraceae bacterium]|nr:DUF3443 domain-containing protein [Anaeromyxobacteraceae bacterium]